ncbi:MAG: DUF4347 domain-containing protein, partial [Granulosicoccus sp.]
MKFYSDFLRKREFSKKLVKRISKVRSTPYIETLEPRILFSADFPGAESFDLQRSNDVSNQQLASHFWSSIQDSTEGQSFKNNTDELYVSQSREESAPTLSQQDSLWKDILTHRPESHSNQPDSLVVNATDSLQLFQESETTPSVNTHLIVIDSTTPDYHLLIEDLTEASDVNYQVHILDSNANGIAQISELLSIYDNVKQLHIISHGEDGAVSIGNSLITKSDLVDHQRKIQEWSGSFTGDADILLYGCDVSSSEVGKQFVELLSNLTGADVASSDDLSGHSILGGDWDLEYETGDIESAPIFSDEVLNDWVGTLAVTIDDITVRDDNDVSVLDFMHNVSGTERLMLVGVAVDADDGEAVTSITSNGVALSRVGFHVYHINDFRIEVWQLVAPDVGANNVVVSFNTIASGGAIAAVTTFNGVDQSTPLGSFASSSGLSSSASLTVGSAVGDTIYSVIGLNDFQDEGLFPLLSASDVWEAYVAEVNGGGSTKLATSSLESVGWSLTDSGKWLLGAVAIKPSTNEAPEITSDGAGATANKAVSENQLFVSTVTATDANTGDSLVYSVTGGTDAGAFTIDETSGELTFSTAPDFESKSSYNVEVTVSDGTLTDVQSITVSVNDANEAPVITNNGSAATDTVAVDENQTAVTTLAATDPDSGATLEYSVSGGVDAGAFTIDGASGELTFSTAPDFESKASYNVEVTASDGTLADVQTITVTINDVNEAPVITNNGSAATDTVEVDENQTAVTTIAATDLDSGATLEYSVSGGVDAGTFTIDSVSGELTFSTAPDYESRASYNVEVTASDGTLTDVQTITVSVNDVNEAPVITNNGSAATDTVAVIENETAVTTIAATDPDAGATL